MEDLEKKAINNAIQSGLKEIVGRNKGLFSGMENYLTVHLDEEKINSKVSELGRIIKDKKIGVMGPVFLYNELKKYIASGSMFDLKEEERLLDKGIEEREKKKGFFYRIKSFFEYLTKPKEQKYFERTLKDANEIYDSFKSDRNLAEINPQYAAYMKDMNALYPFIQLMKNKKVITRDKAKELYEKASKSIEEKTIEFNAGLGKMLEKIAAAIFGVFGIFLIIAGSKISGAVIGSQNSVSHGIAGIGLILISFILLLLSRKK